MTRSLTMAYHAQADGQTEVPNQSSEIFLQVYVGLSRNNWATYLMPWHHHTILPPICH